MKKKIILLLARRMGLHTLRKLINDIICQLPVGAQSEIVESMIAAHCPKKHLHTNPRRKSRV